MTCPPFHPRPAPPAQDRPAPPLPGPPLPPPSAEPPAYPAVDTEPRYCLSQLVWPPVPREGDAARGVFSDLLLRFNTKQGKKKQTVPIVLLVPFVLGRGVGGWSALAQPQGGRAPLEGSPSREPTALLGAEQRGGGGTGTGFAVSKDAVSGGPLDLDVFHQKKGRCHHPALLGRPLARCPPLEVERPLAAMGSTPFPPLVMPLTCPQEGPARALLCCRDRRFGLLVAVAELTLGRREVVGFQAVGMVKKPRRPSRQARAAPTPAGRQTRAGGASCHLCSPREPEVTPGHVPQALWQVSRTCWERKH